MDRRSVRRGIVIGLMVVGWPLLVAAGDLAEMADVGATVTGVTGVIWLIAALAGSALGLFALGRAISGGREHLAENAVVMGIVVILNVFVWRVMPTLTDGIASHAAAATIEETVLVTHPPVIIIDGD